MDLIKKPQKHSNNRISRRKNINLEKLFENDNYLIQTLKRTKRVLLENPAEDLELNLNSALNIINKNITLFKDPEINEYHTENNLFKKYYSDSLKASENTNSLSFNDLIKHYLSHGYKIPNFDFQHNLFKVNPLIEDNSNKMTNYFISQHKKKLTQKDILLLKSILYLNKLNKLIFCKQNKKRASLVNSLSRVQMKLKNIEEREEIGKLKESIETLQKLINQFELEEKAKNQFNFGYRKSHQFIPSFTKLNSLQDHPILQRIQRIRENKTGREKKISSVESGTIDINNKNNVITDSDKSDTKHLRDYLESKMKHKSSKNNIITRNNENQLLPGIYKRFNSSNKNVIPFGLRTETNLNFKKMFSQKTELSSKFNNKNRNRIDEPLFLRTQVSNKKYNKYYQSNKERYFKSRNKSGNIYTHNFANKTEFFDYTYQRLKRGNFEDINKLVKKYLNEVEKKSNEEADMILNKYDYKNFKVNLKELEIDINKKEIDRKTEKIYLNNFISKRVAKKLESMRKKEEQISRLNKLITAIGNHSD